MSGIRPFHGLKYRRLDIDGVATRVALHLER
jgi:hypothetical protein